MCRTQCHQRLFVQIMVEFVLDLFKITVVSLDTNCAGYRRIHHGEGFLDEKFGLCGFRQIRKHLLNHVGNNISVLVFYMIYWLWPLIQVCFILSGNFLCSNLKIVIVLFVFCVYAKSPLDRVLYFFTFSRAPSVPCDRNALYFLILGSLSNLNILFGECCLSLLEGSLVKSYWELGLKRVFEWSTIIDAP